MIMLKKYLLPIVIILCSTAVKAQNNVLLDSAKNELYRINKVFDSSAYLGFAINIIYNTDTCTSTGNTQHYEKRVEYQLNNKDYYYKVDDIEYMQNDSFTVSIDHEEKSMIVTKNNFNQLSGSFMMKDFLNNSINNYDSIYTITITNLQDSISREISFATTDSLSPYTNFSVRYDIESHQPQQIEAGLAEKIAVTDSSQLTGTHTDVLTQKLKLIFVDYRAIPTGKIFDEHNYFYKDRQTKRYQPADKYKYYEFLTAGIDEDEMEDNPKLLKDNSQLPGNNQ
jgi:hypothetical protein